MIPAYCEQSVIGSTVGSVLSVFPNVVVVDDGSDDGTASEARAAGAVVLIHPVNLGQGAALQTGISFALRSGASHIVTFDADGQHRIEDAQTMLDVLEAESLDVALGSRFTGRAENLPRLRKLVLKAAIFFTNFTCGLKLTDTHNGLRVLTARAASQIQLQHNGMAHASEILEQIAQLKLKYREVPITIVYTDYSLAKGQGIYNSLRIVSDIFMGWISK